MYLYIDAGGFSWYVYNVAVLPNQWQRMLYELVELIDAIQGRLQHTVIQTLKFLVITPLVSANCDLRSLKSG